MNSKQLVFLPLLVLGLVSCVNNTNPKPLSYKDAISYINKNSKGKPTSCSGHVSYTCKAIPSASVDLKLKYFGVNDTSKIQGNNKIEDDNITDYLDNSDGTCSASDNADLPLMYLNETNFTKFVKNQSGFSYSLTYVKEFVIYHILKDGTGEETVYYTRYYDTNLRLYKFEIHCAIVGEEFDVTQIFNNL